MNIAAIVPAYNSGPYLKRAIESVLTQTYPIKEVIVIDDGSTDNTAEIVAAFGDRVRYFRQDNAGAASARNLGIRQATSEWIAFLDSDDWWFPEKTARQVRALESEEDAAFCYTSFYLMTPERRQIEEWPAEDPRKLWPMLRCRNRIPPTVVMARRDVLLDAGGFDERLRNAEDWDLWVRIGPDRHRFLRVPEPSAGYQISGDSKSADPEKMIRAMEAMLEGTLLRGLQGWRRALWRNRIRSAEFFRAYIAARDRELGEALDYLAKSFLLWPLAAFQIRWLKSAAASLLKVLGRKRERVLQLPSPGMSGTR